MIHSRTANLQYLGMNWRMKKICPICLGIPAAVLDETQFFFTPGIVTEIDFFLRVTCVSPGCHSRDLKRSLRGLKRSLRRPKRSLRGLKVCVSLACHLRVTFARNC